MGMLARGRKKIFGERITLPLSEEMLVNIDHKLDKGEPRLSFVRQAIQRELDRRSTENTLHYVRATLSEMINNKVFYRLEFRTRDAVVYETQDYRNSGEEAISSILDRGVEFGVDAVVIVGTLPGAIHPRDDEDALPYAGGRTYVRTEEGFEPMQEYPINGQSWSDLLLSVHVAKNRREEKTPNARTKAAMDEARVIRAAKNKA